jgi:hypothetical protein
LYIYADIKLKMNVVIMLSSRLDPDTLRMHNMPATQPNIPSNRCCLFFEEEGLDSNLAAVVVDNNLTR